MDNVSIIDAFNVLSLTLFVTVSTLTFLRIGYRALLFRKAKQALPILLKRDLYLFFSIFIYVIVLSTLRASGVTGLNQNFFWLIFSNALLMGPFAYWAWVEWHQ